MTTNLDKLRAVPGSLRAHGRANSAELVDWAIGIIKQLPRYIDTGEIIPIGGNVHTTDGNGQFILGQMRGFNFCDENGQEAEVFVGDSVRGGYWCTPADDCYSTRAAAEPARAE